MLRLTRKDSLWAWHHQPLAPRTHVGLSAALKSLWLAVHHDLPGICDDRHLGHGYHHLNVIEVAYGATDPLTWLADVLEGEAIRQVGRNVTY